MEIDPFYIQAAAENSPPLKQAEEFNPEKWLTHLSEAEKNDYLLRLYHNETGLTMHLQRQLKDICRQQAKPNTASRQTSPTPRRTIQQLQDSWMAYREAGEQEAKRQAEILAEQKRQEAARHREFHLKQLSQRKEATWHTIDQLVQQGQAKSYDQAAEHLYDLQEIANHEGELELFNEKLQALIIQYQRRRKFIERLEQRNLLFN